MNDTTKLYLSTIKDDVREVKGKCTEIRQLSKEQSDRLHDHITEDTKRFAQTEGQVASIKTSVDKAESYWAERRAMRWAMIVAIVGSLVIGAVEILIHVFGKK